MFRRRAIVTLVVMVAVGSLTVAAAEPTPVPTKQITNSIGMKLTLVPSGEFMMGSHESVEQTIKAFAAYEAEAKWLKPEHPEHRVRISQPFHLGTYHVTRGQFRQFVEATRYRTEAEKDGKGGYGYTSANKWEQKPEFTWRNPGFPQTDEHPVVNLSMPHRP